MNLAFYLPSGGCVTPCSFTFWKSLKWIERRAESVQVWGSGEARETFPSLKKTFVCYRSIHNSVSIPVFTTLIKWRQCWWSMPSWSPPLGIRETPHSWGRMETERDGRPPLPLSLWLFNSTKLVAALLSFGNRWANGLCHLTPSVSALPSCIHCRPWTHRHTLYTHNVHTLSCSPAVLLCI